MRITSKRVADKQIIGAAQRKLDGALEYSAKEMKKLAARRKAAGARPGEGQVGGVHRDLVYEAVRKYGPEVLSANGQEFWDAVKRENPVLAADGRVPGRDSVNGHRNHFGKVKERIRFSGERCVYEKWTDGDWVVVKVKKLNKLTNKWEVVWEE